MRWMVVLPACLLSVFLFAGCWQAPPDESGSGTTADSEELEPASVDPDQEPRQGTPVAVMTTRYGDITIQLRPDLAPKTVANFVKLAEDGFYYNTTFHRVMPGTMVQGGDPKSKDNDPYNDGQGNSGTFLKAEFSKESFVRGTVAMARKPSEPDSASCQFFIVLKRMREWDGEYTVFGEVTDGLEVADKISKSKLAPNTRDHPAAVIWVRDIRVEWVAGDSVDG